MKTLLSQDFVINRFKSIWKDRYDYSELSYKGNTVKVTIICHKHDAPYKFLMTPSDHKQGYGCPKCGVISQSKSRTYTQDEIIIQFKNVWKNKYDYSKFIYKGVKEKGIIICNKHNSPYEFEMNASSHKQGQGCPKCGGTGKLKQDEVIDQFKIKHSDNRYDYSRFIYINNNKKGIVVCHKHNPPYEFEVSPHNHKTGYGCPKCAGTQKLTQEQIINQFKEIWKDRYDYSKFICVNTKTKGTIICHKHSPPYEFKMAPDCHKIGQGCPKCQESKLERAINSVFINSDLAINTIIHDEFTFDGLKYKRKLPLDKAIEYKINGFTHYLIIECHGEQHYSFRRKYFCKTIEQFKHRQYIDKLKKDYVLSHGYIYVEVNVSNIKDWEANFAKNIRQLIFDKHGVWI